MREAHQVGRAIVSKGGFGDALGTCTANVEQIPSLDKAAWRAHIPVPRCQLLDSDSNSNNNSVDPYSLVKEQALEALRQYHEQVQEAQG